jgi:hypothetical protein
MPDKRSAPEDSRAHIWIYAALMALAIVLVLRSCA